MEHDGYLFRNKVIQSVAPIQPRFILFRPNVWPFIPVHVVFLVALLDPVFFFGLFGYTEEAYNEHSTYFYPGVTFFAVVSVLIHALFLLLPMWSVPIRQRWVFQPAPSFAVADFVAVNPYPLKGKPTIVPLVKGDAALAATNPLLRRDDNPASAFFDFQGLKYFWTPFATSARTSAAPLSRGSGAFGRPAKVTQCAIGDYVASRGVPTEAAAEAIRSVVGRNELIIPVPTFKELLAQHMQQPFFVFQVFQSVLWLCDEYWYTAFFSVGLLVLFEGVMVMQRLQQTRSFQTIDRKGGSVFVLRRVPKSAAAAAMAKPAAAAAAVPGLGGTDATTDAPATADASTGTAAAAGDDGDDDAALLRAAAAAAATDHKAAAATEAAARRAEAAALESAIEASRLQSLSGVFGRIATTVIVGTRGSKKRVPAVSSPPQSPLSPCAAAAADVAPPAEAEVGELQWVPCVASSLVPGDVFAFSVGGVVPCDAVLVGGNAITNEATLTGETIPQLKAPGASAPTMAAQLATKGVHKVHILWAGTELVAASHDSSLDSYPPVPTGAAPAAKPAAGGDADGDVRFVVAVCARTGFETKQGALVRTIVHANEPVSVNSGEAYAFIGVLVCVALAASGYVLHTGLQDPSRNRWKLFVHCIMLVTLVVPTDVPMQLSMAIQTALLALVKDHATFCVEPFRVPAAGQATLVAFDKTGTLTSDTLSLVGVAACAGGVGWVGGDGVAAVTSATEKGWGTAPLPSQGAASLAAAELAAAQTQLVAPPSVAARAGVAAVAAATAAASASAAAAAPPVVCGHVVVDPPPSLETSAFARAVVTRAGDTPAAISIAVAGCHALSLQRKIYRMPRPRPVPGQPLPPVPPPRDVTVPAGDPAEQAAVAALGWELKDPNTAVHASGAVVKVVRRYPFTADLKRMSTVITAPAPFGPCVVIKGAPEVCKPLFTKGSVPADYDAVCGTLMRKGYRVLAFGMKSLKVDAAHGGDRHAAAVAAHAKALPRSEAESGHVFLGLAVFEATLKGEAAVSIRALAASLHTAIMVTGDSPLTAVAVSEQVGIIPPTGGADSDASSGTNGSSPPATASRRGGNVRPPHSPLSPTTIGAYGASTMPSAPTPGGALVFVDVAVDDTHDPIVVKGSGGDDEVLRGIRIEVRDAAGRVAAHCSIPPVAPVAAATVGVMEVADAIRAAAAACLDGTSVAALCGLASAHAAAAGAHATARGHAIGHATAVVDAVVERARVFARCSPSAKVLVIDAFARRGHTTVMCGDGTNDVGALRRADVGIALLPPVPPPPPPSKEEQAKLDAEVAARNARVAAMTPQERQQEQVKEMQQMFSDMWNGRQPGSSASAAQAESLAAAAAAGAEIVENGVAKLGDASVAAPFTHRGPDVRGVVHLLRYGRSALVVTQRMYKIVALNCLASAYAHAILAHEGVRQSETQNILFMVLMTGGYFFLTRSFPLEALAPVRPHSRIFNFHLITSVAGQFMLAFYVMLRVLNMVYEAEPTLEEPRDLDDPFQPSLLNTCMFLVSAVANVATFGANYKGWPWMTGLQENKAMRTTLTCIGVFCIVLASELSPEINEAFQFVPFPTDSFRREIVSLLSLHIMGAFTIEYVADFLFGPKAPKGAGPGIVVPPLALATAPAPQPGTAAGAAAGTATSK